LSQNKSPNTPSAPDPGHSVPGGSRNTDSSEVQWLKAELDKLKADLERSEDQLPRSPEPPAEAAPPPPPSPPPPPPPPPPPLPLPKPAPPVAAAAAQAAPAPPVSPPPAEPVNSPPAEPAVETSSVPPEEGPPVIRPRSEAVVAHLPPGWYQGLNNVCLHIKLHLGNQAFRSIVLTGCRRGEGTTTVTANLARVMASVENGNLLVVDADPGHADLHNHFNTRLAPGLSDVLRQEVGLTDAVIQSDIENLYVMPAGRQVEDVYRLLSTADMNHFLSQVRHYFANVLFDAPPVLVAPHTELLIKYVGHIILVDRSKYSRREVAQRSVEKISAKQKILGVIFNQREMVIPPSVYKLIK
jgi:capsular exopolysaccharide synthesis family protein